MLAVKLGWQVIGYESRLVPFPPLLGLLIKAAFLPLLGLLFKAASPPLLRLVKVESPPLLGLLVKIASPPLLATMEILLAVTSVMPFFQSACMHGSIF